MGSAICRAVISPDLIKAFEEYKTSPTSFHVENSRSVENAELIINFTGQEGDSVSVEHNKKHYTFFCVQNPDPDCEGKLRMNSPNTFLFQYRPENNGMKLLVFQLFECLHEDTHFGVCFNGKRRSIKDCCTFEQLFKATTLWTRKVESKQDMDFIRDHFINIKIMYVRSPLPRGYEEFPLFYHHAVFEKDFNLTLEHLENMKCEHLTLRDTDLDQAEVNSFLKKWQQNKIQLNLWVLRIANFPPRKDIFKDLQVKQWEIYDGFLEGFAFGKEYLKKTAAYKIQRSDGTIGMFMWSNGHFYFFVWNLINEFFPKIPSNYPKLENSEDSNNNN